MRLASTCRLYTFCILFNIYIYFFFLNFLSYLLLMNTLDLKFLGKRTHTRTDDTYTHLDARELPQRELEYLFSLNFL